MKIRIEKFAVVLIVVVIVSPGIQAELDSHILGYTKASIGLPTSGEYWGIDFGDVNKDGFLDIGVTKGGTVGAYLYLGDGTGKWKYKGEIAPYNGGITFYDWNKDGKLDFAVGDWQQGPTGRGLHVYKGDGTGTFTHVCKLADGKFGAVEFCDFNKDGKVDIVSAGQKQVRAWAGDGTGNWVEKSTGLPKATNYQYFNVKVGDVNNDGNLDIAVAGEKVAVYKGDGTGKWYPTTAISPNGKSCALGLGDVNNDGKLDLVAGGYLYELPGIHVWLGDGNFNWKKSSTGLPNKGQYCDLRIADMTKDGNKDLVIAGYWKGLEGILLYKGDGTGKWTDISGTLPKDQCVGVDVDDINNDGFLDIGATFYKKGVQVWKDDTIPEFGNIVIPIVTLIFAVSVIVRTKKRKL